MRRFKEAMISETMGDIAKTLHKFTQKSNNKELVKLAKDFVEVHKYLVDQSQELEAANLAYDDLYYQHTKAIDKIADLENSVELNNKMKNEY